MSYQTKYAVGVAFTGSHLRRALAHTGTLPIARAGVKESAPKPTIKEAHRKVMLLNHPDRGGSPYIASKINQASEVMMGQDRSSGSAFS